MFRILPQITHQTPFNSDYFSIYYMLYINFCLFKNIDKIKNKIRSNNIKFNNNLSISIIWQNFCKNRFEVIFRNYF